MLSTGETICHEEREYRILELLGRGRNTAAFLAECRHDGMTSKCILKECISGDNAAFIASVRMQNRIRQLSSLGNQTPPVSRIFISGGSAYADVVCFGGTTLDRLSLTLPQLTEICLTVTRTVGHYHRAGWLCLDIKPENIFILQNSPDETVTQLVEFIDFDSVRRSGDSIPVSYTADWCAPEQRSAFGENISPAADIYSLGELVFYSLFGRHSTEREHRGFSKYPFGECRKEYRRFTDRPDICRMFTQLFRGTLRSSAVNRFQSTEEIAALLEAIIPELKKRDYVIPRLPSVPNFFLGREQELAAISDCLDKSPVLFITGVGGIGKSTLAKEYMNSRKTDYDTVIYLEYTGDIIRTFCDDMQLQLSTLSHPEEDSPAEYFDRKLLHLRRICGDRRVLLILDNFSGRITKELSRILDCGYDTLIVTRTRPPLNSFAVLEVGSISDRSKLMKLISLNLGRYMTKEEQSCFEEIVTLVQGHTLVLELIARQTAAGRLDIRSAAELIRQHGFSRFSDSKVSNYKDGEEIYGTLSAIVTALFDAGGMTSEELTAIKTLALLNVRGLSSALTERILKIKKNTLNKLETEGWIYAGDRVKQHPVIAETFRIHRWPDIPAVEVMEHHKDVIAVYEGTADAEQIKSIVREAEEYNKLYTSHMTAAMLRDMEGSYYDTLLGGAIPAYTDEERDILCRLISSMETAISEAEKSSYPGRDRYLAKYLLSLAAVLIRSDPAYHPRAKELLDRADALITPDDRENRCYHCMVTAWYCTLAEPDLPRTKELTGRAARLAELVFTTDIELIDIICIPAANCLFYHYDYEGAAEKLSAAADLCKAHPLDITYTDKLAELLCCLMDVYAEQDDREKCLELFGEIEFINNTYRDEGINRQPGPEALELIK